MKLVREHINEKFTEDSDPIKDLDIGVDKILKKYNLPSFCCKLNTKDKEVIKEFFGVSWNKVYFLGDDEDYRDKIGKSMGVKIRNLIKNGKKIFSKKYDYSTDVKGYETKYGKILIMNDTLYEYERIYMGEAAVAYEVGVHKIDWEALDYYYNK